MENIVRLSEYRMRRKPAPRPDAPPKGGAQYVCTRCESPDFRLSALGMVHCAHCSALMRNLLVSPIPDPGA